MVFDEPSDLLREEKITSSKFACSLAIFEILIALLTLVYLMSLPQDTPLTFQERLVPPYLFS